ncbi:MAG: type VI secretion system baseplate subunit TssE [Kiritimatiellaeota bacterium]|nr:type VI secretion system baseplate subunit TssE [Kiritimatiellota bacterium]
MRKLENMSMVMPCLLDRLVDDQPHVRSGENKDIFTARYLKSAILRDLIWLLNSKSKTSTGEFSKFPEVGSSVLNFGIDDLCGFSYEGTDLKVLEQTIKDSIIQFEPRLDPETLIVRLFRPKDGSSMSSFEVEISGTIIATPMPEELIIHSTVDAESGRFELWDK